MVPPFDIFRIFHHGEPHWLECAQTIEEAKVRVQQLCASDPGEYMIFSQKTGNKISIKVEQAAKAGT